MAAAEGQVDLEISPNLGSRKALLLLLLVVVLVSEPPLLLLPLLLGSVLAPALTSQKG